jgi:hypothetical protein
LELVELAQFMAAQLLVLEEYLGLQIPVHLHYFWPVHNLEGLQAKMEERLLQLLEQEEHLIAMPEEQPMLQAQVALEAVLLTLQQVVVLEEESLLLRKHLTAETGQPIHLSMCFPLVEVDLLFLMAAMPFLPQQDLPQV